MYNVVHTRHLALGRTKRCQPTPMEIQVLNHLVKHKDRLNVNSASYTTHPQSPHVPLLFANDSPIYESTLIGARGSLRYT